MRDRRDYAIAALGAALLFCLGILLGQRASVLPEARAQDTLNPEAPVSTGAGQGGGIVIDTTPGQLPGVSGGKTTAHTSDSDSNNRFVAVTCPVGSGENVLFLIDSKTEQVAVYGFKRGKGLTFLAGRKIEYDLKISGYQDVSEFSYDEMRGLYHKQAAAASAKAAKNTK